MKSRKSLLITLLVSMISATSLSTQAKVERYYAPSKVERVDNQHIQKGRKKVVHTKPIHRNPVHKKHTVIVAPRHRQYKHIVVVRPYGHSYLGYGGFYSDDEAWRWLAFTAVTLKVLDNLNEQAQREHESAQVKATTAPVGEKITWDTEDSTGYVVATKEGKDANGQQCREFMQEITVGGNTEQAYGTACLQPDGAWKIVS